MTHDTLKLCSKRALHVALTRIALVALIVASIVLTTLLCIPKARAEELPIPLATAYDYFYPSVTLEYSSGSDYYTASVSSSGVPSQPVLTVTEPYSGLDYYEILDPITAVVTGYQLVPPTGGYSPPSVTFNTPMYISGNLGIPLTVTETGAEWNAQVCPSDSASIVFVQFTGTFQEFRVHLWNNYQNSLLLQFSGSFDSYSIEIRVDVLDSADYLNNIRGGIDTTMYYDDGYVAGYASGRQVGKTEGYEDGYEAGSEAGYEDGYEAGRNDVTGFNPIKWLLRCLDSVFEFNVIRIGNFALSVGDIIGVSLLVPLLLWFLKLFAGG